MLNQGLVIVVVYMIWGNFNCPLILGLIICTIGEPRIEFCCNYFSKTEESFDQIGCAIVYSDDEDSD